LAIIVEKPRCIDHEPKLSHFGDKRRGMFQASLIQQIDWRRRLSTEASHLPEAVGGAQRCNQGAADTAAGPEHHSNASLRK
jgi:hypothetical protein